MKKYIDAEKLEEATRNKIHDADAEDVQEVKHGKWERLTIDFKKCSICGAKYFTIYADSFDYCPNCGARMDGDGK